MITTAYDLDMRRYDGVLVRNSTVAAMAILALTVFDLAMGSSTTVVAPLILLVYSLSLVMRAGLCDPVPMIGIALFLYSFIPQFVQPHENRFLVVFGLEGARYIYLCATFAYLISVALAAKLLPWRPRPVPSEPPVVSSVASMGGAVVACLLSLAFIAQNGLVIGGDVDYESGFELRMQTGAGVFLLAIPLTSAAFAIAVAAGKRLLSAPVLLSSASFFLLYLAHGQRKFLVIPIILLAAARVRRASLPVVIGFVLAAILLLNSFSYLGYLRTAEIPFADALEDYAFAGFFRNYTTNLAGAETMMLYATASAAFKGVVAPLPYFGDYLLSWMQAFPRFLLSVPYVPFNYRFSATVTPEAAAVGQGWGFSFWGEAYAVGGEAMILVTAFLSVLFFRALFRRAQGARLIGPAGAILLISVYYAIWFQRNAFGIILREFLVFHVIAVVGLFFAGRIFVDLFMRRTAQRRDATAPAPR